MFTTQNPDPGQRKIFLLWRPFVAVWDWLVPRSVAHADRQPRVARFVAAGLVTVICLTLVVVVMMNSRAWHRSFKHWQAAGLVKDAEKFELQATEFHEQKKTMEFQDTMVKAFRLASDAFMKDPESPDTIRVAARIYTRAGANEARWLWNKLDKLEAMTDDDVVWRIRALSALKEDKTAADQIEEVLRNRPVTQKIVQVADTVMQNLGRSQQLLTILRSYSAKEPGDLDARLMLGMRLIQFAPSEREKDEGKSILWQLADNDAAVGLRAIEFLDQSRLSKPEQQRLLERLEKHPLAGEPHRIAALKRQAELEPARKQEILRQAVASRRGLKREELVPLARWLYQERDAEKLLDLLKEDDVRDYPPLLHDYFNALTMVGRYADLERLVRDPRSRFTNAERDFHLVHLAFVRNTLTHKPDDEIDKLLVNAVNSALRENQVQMLLELGSYAEARKHHRTAMEAYKAASVNPRTERPGYEGMLRASYNLGSMKDYSSIARETARRWPSNQYFTEQYLYACLLSGDAIETTTERARVLAEARPRDSQRKLFMALAAHRLGDRDACARWLQNSTIQDLTPGQRAVFSGLARSVGFAEEAARLAKAIPDNTPMLPEEEKFLLLARAVAVNS